MNRVKTTHVKHTLKARLALLVGLLLLLGFAPCLHTSFPICLLKFSCNLYSMSTCLMTNTLRVLESRVFLHYLIKARISSLPLFVKDEWKNTSSFSKTSLVLIAFNCLALSLFDNLSIFVNIIL